VSSAQEAREAREAQESPVAHLTEVRAFADLGLPDALVTALEAGGIEEPFPVQALCIPPALAGRDVCGKAKTGSGKTLAFGLPLLARVPAGRPTHPKAVVLVPTRELAIQVHDVLEPLARAIGRRVVAVYGGAPMERQIKALKTGADIVVATPGRLIDLGERADLDVSEVEFLVLDEADRMADMGFLPQVEWVLRRLPAKRQTMLFSATLDGEVDHLRRHYLTDPLTLSVEEEQDTIEEMEHRFIAVHQLDKVKVLEAISRGAERTMVFVRTKRGADRLVLQLARENVKAAAIHGDLRQSQREKALNDFSAGKLRVLVATDVAARGIHVDHVDIVIHYDPPEDYKGYLHRSGRTARAGEAGLVVTLVLWDQRADMEVLQKRVGIRMPVVEMLSNDPRLLDLRAWEPDPLPAPPAEAAAAAAAPEPPSEQADQPAVSPAVAVAQAVAARKAAQRKMPGRRGRR
jgi:superfamily II DNA/RNA helicase